MERLAGFDARQPLLAHQLRDEPTRHLRLRYHKIPISDGGDVEAVINMTTTPEALGWC
ncbi:MAG: hypothetical protein H0X37_00720 [Herpetosiphonaceae bacterium]|nr:hypothetical protein [Herpetosiphonaceae bacterium]